MELSEEELVIAQSAVDFAKKQKKAIAKKLTDMTLFAKESEPVSVFMAGSPGAGKTEVAKELIRLFAKPMLHLDIDELRKEFDGYTGGNAYLFQAGANILLERCHDMALKNGQSFILDGTMATYAIAEKNIRRSLKKKRFVQIVFVYQEPLQAWRFVQAREKAEGRRVIANKFITQFFGSRVCVNRLKSEFGRSITLDLLIKNMDGSMLAYHTNIDSTEGYIKDQYTEDDLNELIL